MLRTIRKESFQISKIFAEETAEESLSLIIYAEVDARKPRQRNNGGYSGEDTPLPIPNREVKPVCADGTAIPSGRVGSRRL